MNLRQAQSRVRMMIADESGRKWDLSPNDRAALSAVYDRLDVLEKECAQMSGELGLPPTIRPAEGELRRMQEALGRAHKLEAAIYETLALVTSRDPVVLSPFDALGVYKLALEHLRARLNEGG